MQAALHLRLYGRFQRELHPYSDMRAAQTIRSFKGHLVFQRRPHIVGICWILFRFGFIGYGYIWLLVWSQNVRRVE